MKFFMGTNFLAKDEHRTFPLLEKQLRKRWKSFICVCRYVKIYQCRWILDYYLFILVYHNISHNCSSRYFLDYTIHVILLCKISPLPLSFFWLFMMEGGFTAFWWVFSKKDWNHYFFLDIWHLLSIDYSWL